MSNTDPKYFLLADLPKDFQEHVISKIWHYSVALGFCSKGTKDIIFFGSGVLVVKDGHYGILTARHCLHDRYSHFNDGSFNGNMLAIAYKRSHTVLPPEILIEHHLAIPKQIEGEPDLTFVEICDCPKLRTLKSVNSFWPMGKNPYDVKPAFGRIEMPFCVNGFLRKPDYKRDGNTIRTNLKHMSFFNVHGSGSFSAEDEWDYVQATDKKDDKLSSFEGMSGGPVWGLQIIKQSENKFALKDWCLIGINISQIESGEDEISVRAHFIQSIYDVAWRNIQWRSPGIIFPAVS